MNFDHEYLKKFNSRFSEFRAIEASIVAGKRKENSCGKAFSLLYDMELCFAAKAYFACLIIACAAIEACLNHEFGNEGNLKSKIVRSGYEAEADWLRIIRNKIIHKNDSTIVSHFLVGKQEEELKVKCKNALKLVHEIYYNPIKIDQ